MRHQSLSFEDAVKQYSITGGVPKYLEFFNERDDLLQQVESVILSKNGFLYEEPNFLLKDEVTSAVNYFSIIRVIAEGNHKLGKIAGAMGIRDFRPERLISLSSAIWLLSSRTRL